MAPLFTANWFNFGKNPSSTAGSSLAPPYAGPWVEATGGNASPTVPANQHQPGDYYRYHVFTSPGNFVVSAPGPVDILLIGGGGGGGGGNRGAAAGAGGLVFRPNLTLPTATYPVSIGDGGEAGNYSSSNEANVGQEGTQSSFASPTQPQRLIGMGGGRGGCADPNNPANHGRPGGSGGSSWYPGYPADPYGEGRQTNEPTIPADSRTYGFGSDCGQSGSSPVYSGGGGGAGAAGAPFDLPSAEEGIGGIGKYYDWADNTAPPTTAGDGLSGFPFSPYAGKFAGGGTAGDYNADVRAEPPGPTVGGYWYGGGLGDNLANPPNSEPKSKGGTNTGGGGGASGDGGPGLCIVRYSIQSN